MMGFPLSLPIEATLPRGFYLSEIKAETLPAGYITTEEDHVFQFKMDVTPQEATALRAWLNDRAQSAQNDFVLEVEF